jgi:hypothetical protein
MDEEDISPEGEPIAAISKKVVEASDIPPSLLFVMLIIIVICAVSGMTNYTMEHPKFLTNQMAINFSFVVLISFFFGVIVNKLSEESIIRKHAHLFLPLILIIIMWAKTYFIYAINLNEKCGQIYDKDLNQYKSGYKSTSVFFNSSKVPMAIFFVYSFINLFSFATMPFFELFDSTSPIIANFAIGFWLGCATWPAEASAYYSLMKYGCSPSGTIELKDVSNIPDPSNPPTTDDN